MASWVQGGCLILALILLPALEGRVAQASHQVPAKSPLRPAKWHLLDALRAKAPVSSAARFRQQLRQLRQQLSLEQQSVAIQQLKLRHGMRMKRAYQARTGVKGGPCSGPQAELCDSSYKFAFPSAPVPAHAQAECLASLCLPICLRMTWGVDFVVSCPDDGPVTVNQSDFAMYEIHQHCIDLKAQLAQPRFKGALESQLVAHGCDHMLECCPMTNPRNIPHWAEDHNYAGFWPNPSATLIPGGHHDPDYRGQSSALCSMCQSAVQVVVEPKTDCSMLPVQPKPSSAWAFDNSDIVMANQVPKHKSFQERCVKMAAFIQAQFPDMESVFQGDICIVMGLCGDDQLTRGLSYYPLHKVTGA